MSDLELILTMAAEATTTGVFKQENVKKVEELLSAAMKSLDVSGRILKQELTLRSSPLKAQRFFGNLLSILLRIQLSCRKVMMTKKIDVTV